MIDREHFRRISDIEYKSFSGLSVIPFARGLVEAPPLQDKQESDNGIYVMNGTRQYRLEKINGAVKIEGHIIPREDKQASLIDRLDHVEHLIPVIIFSDGKIESEGVRVNPHDERLAILAADLKRPVGIASRTYQWHSSRIE